MTASIAEWSKVIAQYNKGKKVKKLDFRISSKIRQFF